MAEVNRTHIRAAVQVRCAPGIVVAIHRGHDGPDARLAFAQILTQPQDTVVGSWFDRRTTYTGDVLGHRIDRANREAAGEAACELRGAKDGRKRRGRGVRIRARQLGRPSDAPRAHEAFTGVAVVHGRAVNVELERPRALHEEGTLLLEERLER